MKIQLKGYTLFFFAVTKYCASQIEESGNILESEKPSGMVLEWHGVKGNVYDEM